MNSVTLKYVFWCLLAVCLHAPAAFAKDPPPPAPTAEAPKRFTKAWAEAPTPPGACEAINAMVGSPYESDASLDGRGRLYAQIGFADSGMALDPYPGLEGAALVAAIRKESDALLACDHSPAALMLFAQVELYLLRAHRAGVAADAVAALDLAVSLSNNCKDSGGDMTCVDFLVHRAGALGEAGRADDAFASLKQAIDGGFLAVGWLHQTDVLATLRKHPEWDKRLAAMLPPSLGPLPKALPEDLSLSISPAPHYRSATIFALCTDKRIARAQEIMGTLDAWEHGTWELKQDGLWATFSQSCEREVEEDEATVTCKPTPSAKPERLLSAVEMRAYLSPDYEETGFNSSTNSTLCGDDYKPVEK